MDFLSKKTQDYLARWMRGEVPRPPPSPKSIGKVFELHRKHVDLPKEIVASNLGITLAEMEYLELGLYVPSEEQVEILSTLYGLNLEKVKRMCRGYDKDLL